LGFGLRPANGGDDFKNDSIWETVFENKKSQVNRREEAAVRVAVEDILASIKDAKSPNDTLT
jgi:hypothetical protein